MSEPWRSSGRSLQGAPRDVRGRLLPTKIGGDGKPAPKRVRPRIGLTAARTPDEALGRIGRALDAGRISAAEAKVALDLIKTKVALVDTERQEKRIATLERLMAGAAPSAHGTAQRWKPRPDAGAEEPGDSQGTSTPGDGGSE